MRPRRDKAVFLPELHFYATPQSIANDEERRSALRHTQALRRFPWPISDYGTRSTTRSSTRRSGYFQERTSRFHRHHTNAANHLYIYIQGSNVSVVHTNLQFSRDEAERLFSQTAGLKTRVVSRQTPAVLGCACPSSFPLVLHFSPIVIARRWYPSYHVTHSLVAVPHLASRFVGNTLL